MKKNEARLLANRYDDFAYDYDPYEYADCIGISAKERNIERERLESNIASGNIQSYIDALNDIASDAADASDRKEAQKLIKDLNETVANEEIELGL